MNRIVNAILGGRSISAAPKKVKRAKPLIYTITKEGEVLSSGLCEPADIETEVKKAFTNPRVDLVHVKYLNNKTKSYIRD